jgi:hypothetical protein
MLSPMRLLITAAGLAVVIIGSLLLLNWWMVSCGRLACDIKPAWAAAEASTPDSCPPDLKAAATDATWARGIVDNLPTRQPRTKTIGWLFTDGVATQHLTSGQGSRDNPDALWLEAKKLLAAAPVDQPRGGAHPAASHVESKSAVWLRQNKITYAVLVINHRKGPCGEEEDQAEDPYTCAVVVRAILPVGTTMVVWWWSDQDGRMVSVSYEGAAT